MQFNPILIILGFAVIVIRVFIFADNLPAAAEEKKFNTVLLSVLRYIASTMVMLIGGIVDFARQNTDHDNEPLCSRRWNYQ